jgi:hypothetical protein
MKHLVQSGMWVAIRGRPPRTASPVYLASAASRLTANRRVSRTPMPLPERLGAADFEFAAKVAHLDGTSTAALVLVLFARIRRPGASSTPPLARLHSIMVQSSTTPWETAADCRFSTQHDAFTRSWRRRRGASAIPRKTSCSRSSPSAETSDNVAERNLKTTAEVAGNHEDELEAGAPMQPGRQRLASVFRISAGHPAVHAPRKLIVGRG